MTDPTPDPIDVAGFDIEAWANGAVAARDSVQVSSRAGLAGEMIDLLAQHKEAAKKDTRAAAKRAELKALEEQINEKAAALEGSWVDIEFRTPTPSERRKAFVGTDDEDAEQRVANLLSVVARLRPHGTEEWQTLAPVGWLRIFETIGTGQYDELMLKFNGVAFTKSVTPGFSQRALSYLKTRGSDKS